MKRRIPIVRLPRRERRYERLRGGTGVSLILVATGVILDIVEDAAG